MKKSIMIMMNRGGYNKEGPIKENRYILYLFIMLCLLITPSLPFAKAFFDIVIYIPIIYWSVVVMGIFFIVPRIHVPGHFSMQGIVRGHAASAAVIYIAISFVAGAVLKKLKGSPYDLTPSGILLNFLLIFSVLIGRELIRAFYLGTLWRYFKFRHIHIVLFTLLMTATEINFYKLRNIGDEKELVIFIINDVFLILSKNILITVFVFYGDFITGVLYGGITEAFLKFSPVLPELPWLATGVIGIAFPIIYAMFIGEKFKDSYEGRKLRSNKGSIGYLISLGLSVLFFWFCIGVFQIYPSVVLTGSMEPVIFPGDVVFIRKMKTQEDISRLTNGDIINFKREEITITHRIMEIKEDEAGNLSFVTKGDNNSSQDDRVVQPNEINGIIIKVIPKAGLPVIILNKGKEIPSGVIDEGEKVNDGK